MVILLVQLVDAVMFLYSLVIVARAFLPLIGADTTNPVIRFIFDITEPILAPLRRFTIVGMWDFSPLAALVILWIIQQALHSFVFSVLH
jgi:YggT family protein